MMSNNGIVAVPICAHRFIVGHAVTEHSKAYACRREEFCVTISDPLVNKCRFLWGGSEQLRMGS